MPAEGYDFVKVYSKLDPETFTAIVDEARRLNMRVIGHIPGRNKGITAIPNSCGLSWPQEFPSSRVRTRSFRGWCRDTRFMMSWKRWSRPA